MFKGSTMVLHLFLLLSLTHSLCAAPISFRFEGDNSILNVALEALGFASSEATSEPEPLKGFRIVPIVKSGAEVKGLKRSLRAPSGEKIVVAVDEGVLPEQVIHASMTREQRGDDEMAVKLSLRFNEEGRERLEKVSIPGTYVAVMVGEELFLRLLCRGRLTGASMVVTAKVNRRTLLSIERALRIKSRPKAKKKSEKILNLARKAVEQEKAGDKEHLACTYLQIAWKAVQSAKKYSKEADETKMSPGRSAFEKGMVCAMSLEIDEATRQFEKAAEYPHFRPMALSYLGDICKLRGKKKQARQHYLEAKTSIPDEKKAHFSCMLNHIDKRLAALAR